MMAEKIMPVNLFSLKQSLFKKVFKIIRTLRVICFRAIKDLTTHSFRKKFIAK